MSSQLELLIALLALLAGVLYAWIAVQGWRPWPLMACGGRARRATPGAERDFRDTSPEVLFLDSAAPTHTNNLHSEDPCPATTT